MNVKLNNESYEVAEGTTLGKFIESLDLQLKGVAVAIDYEIIAKKKWSETILTDGMMLLLIHSVSGG